MKLLPIAPQNSHLTAIDGWRGVAILMVLAFHWYHYFLFTLNERVLFPFTPSLLNFGKNGVPIFLIVSSFTLFRSCALRFEREKNPIGNFYLRRAFRILPLWWTALSIHHLAYGISWTTHLKCCFTLLFGFSLRQIHPILGGWSLFVEESVYLFLPLLFLWVRSLKRATFFLALTLGVRFFWNYWGRRWEIVTRNTLPELFPLAYWHYFGIGIWLFFAFPFLKKSRHLSFHWFRRLVLHNRFIRLCGICCYSLYLFNGLAVIKLKKWSEPFLAATSWRSYPLEIKFALSFPLFVVGILGVAIFFYQRIELPCIQIGKRFTR